MRCRRALRAAGHERLHRHLDGRACIRGFATDSQGIDCASVLRRLIGLDWDIGKRRDFQNDVLIALTARRQGAIVVTRNQADFELLAQHVPFKLMIV
jgi:hypothetical protein